MQRWGATERMTYVERLLAELDVIERAYVDILNASSIKNIDPPNRSGSGIIFIGAAKWGGWESSDNDLESAAWHCSVRSGTGSPPASGSSFHTPPHPR